MTHSSVRDKCYALASELNHLLPPGREKSLALARLEEVMFWSNAAVARERSRNAQAEARARSA